MADTATVDAVIANLPGVMFGQVEKVDAARKRNAAEAACETVEAYAPDAPDAIKLEAATQMTGYLIGTQPNAIRRNLTDPSGTAAEIEFDGQATRNAFRSSRASALLSPFKRRRAGAIG